MILPLVVLYLILAPGANYSVLIPCLTAVGLAGFAAVLKTSAVFRWSLPYFWLISWGVFVLLVGWLAGNQPAGLIDTAVPLVAGPLFWLVATYAAGPRLLRYLTPVVAIGVFCVSLVAIGILFGTKVPILSDLNANLGGNRFGDIGVTKVRLTSASSLIPGVPYLMTITTLGFRSMPRSHRVLVSIALPLGIVGLLMAGRQAGILTAVVAIVLIPFVPRFLKSEQGLDFRLPPLRVAQLALLSVVALSIAIRLGINPVRLVNRFLASMGLSEDDTLQRSYSNRTTQISALWDGFKSAPLFGNGAGATTSASVRSEEYPWRFEMQYHLLLFEGGLLALALVANAFRLASAEIRRQARHSTQENISLLAATSVAALSMIVGNGTNPYLRQVGLQVWIFLPFMVVHAEMRTQAIKTRITNRAKVGVI